MNRKITLILAAIVLVSLMISLVGCNNTKNTTDLNQQTAAEEVTEAVSLVKEESDIVGEWKVTYGYNATEGKIKEKYEISITMQLNDDLTGKIDDNGSIYTFTWKYDGTEAAEHEPSAKYMNYSCKLDPDSDTPADDPLTSFSFDISTEDSSTIYLTFGNWLYLCSKG